MDDAWKRQSPLRQRPWDKDVCAPLPSEAGFAPQEHWAWARIIRGQVADMRYFPKDDPLAQAAGDNGPNDEGGDDPTAADGWPAHRDISARFMRAILFQEPWAGARASPQVRILSARFRESLDWENEHFRGELGLRRCLVLADANWMGLKVGSLLNLNGSRFEKALDADRLRADGGLFCRDRFSAKEIVRLLGARIGGSLDFSGAKLESGLHADGVIVDGDLFLSDFSSKGVVRLLRARVGGVVSLIGSSFDEVLQADGLTVEGSCFFRNVDKLNAANLNRARIGGNLQLSSSVVEGELRLTGAAITGELNLAQAAGDEPKWGEQARLVLRNVRAGALAGGLDAFRRGKDFVPCDLTGFSYDRIGGLGAGARGSTLASASGPDLRRWLRRCRPKDHFDPAPYRALARALADAGRGDRAADVRNALGNYELVATGTPLLQRFMLALSWLFIGYGERNHRAFMWFVALVLLAAGVGYWQDLKWLPLGRPDGWKDWQAWRDWIGFAFGDAVPLVTFDESHKTFLADRFAPFTVPTSLTGFFYGVKVAGFVILSYLAAGLSGLAQHKE